MKKFLCLFLSFLLLLSLFSCAPKLEGVEGETEAEAEKKTEEKEKIDWSTWEKPEGFTAGFGKVDVTPSLPVEVNGNKSTANAIKTKLAITCTAVCDGENVALIFGLDMRRCENSFAEHCQNLIAEKFGIKKEFCYFNTTHSHSTPDGSAPNNTKWRKQTYTAVEEAVEMALKDLKPAEIYTGIGDTTGFAFVRRYLMEDGSYKGIHSGISDKLQYVEHETEADAELRTIRFDRGEEEKDIILVNWQCHAASDAGSKINSQSVVSADYVHYMREDLEESLGAHVGFINGASGNINMYSYLPGEQQFKTVDELGVALSGVVLEQALENETKVESGTIRAGFVDVECTFYKDPPEKVSAAAGFLSETNKSKDYLWQKYHINSEHEARNIQSRTERDGTEMVPVYALSFGDIAFVGAPYEMMDQTGMQIREASPFKMTFISAYTNGTYGYIPDAQMWDHGQYEVYVSRYVKGTGETLRDAMIGMLRDQKAQG